MKSQPSPTEQGLPSTDILVAQMQQLLLAQLFPVAATSTKFLECNLQSGVEVIQTSQGTWGLRLTFMPPAGATSD